MSNLPMSDLHQRILTELAREQVQHDPAAAMRRVAECGAAGLGVPRCSVWLYDAPRTQLRCLDLFDARSVTHATSGSLEVATFPAYIRALDDGSPLAADDVLVDPRTCELKHYFEGQGISSMLDAPIRVAGRTVGVVCHESFAPRRWHDADLAFASAMAAHVAQALDATANA